MDKSPLTGNPYSFSHLLTTTKLIFLQADTTTVRVILAFASLLFAIGMWFAPQTLNMLPAYTLMHQVAGSGVWGTVFFLHFVGLSWRFLDPKPRVGWSLAINCYGFLIWFVSSISMDLSLGFFAPGQASELALCLFAGWALLRTGSRNEILSP